MTPAEAVAYLEAARDRLKGRWIQGDYSDGGDPQICGVCATGALCWAVTGDPTIGMVLDRKVRHLEGLLEAEIGGQPLADYNDHYAIQEIDVRRIFDRAITTQKRSA